MTTLADALSGMARPLARLVAQWRNSPPWRRRAVRIVYPELARRLDEFDRAVENRLGPP